MAFDVKDRLNLTPQEYRGREVNRFMEIGNDFNTTAFDKEKVTAMPNMNLSIAGGKLFEFAGGKKLGIMFSSSFKNEFEHLPDVIQSPVVERQGGGTQINFTSQKYNYSVLFSNMANITFALNDKHEFRYDVLYLNNGVDGFNKKVGLNEDWGEDKDYVIFLSNYQNYRLFNNQLQGSHVLSEKLKVDWNCNLINAKYAVPDRREIGFEPYGDQYTFMNETGFRAGRIIVEQNTDEQNAKLSLGYDVNEKFNVVAGGQYNSKKLEYFSHAYDYVMEANLEDVGLFDIDDDSYSDALQGLNQGAGYVSRIRNWTRDDMGYTGNSSIAAGFVDFTFKTTKLTINVGLRIEKSEMNLTSNMTELDGDEEEYTFDDTDLFPAFNAKYSLSDKANLRMAVSRTVVRPSFYEKTPAYLYPEPGELTIMGNPYTKEEPNADMGYLENSYSTNFDIKYEWFPTQGDMLALSIYGKNISEPIERVQLEKEVYMRNLNQDALAAGVELEVKKKINDFTVGMNAAYIYTHIDIPEENGENDSERGLQGAAPYLINADAGYNFKLGLDDKVNTYVGFVYNVFGKRLYKVGVDGIGNAYQLPINKLDFLVKNKINNKLDINLTINNLLDSKFTIEQDIYDSNDRVAKNKVTDEYKTGVTVGIGVSYKF